MDHVRPNLERHEDLGCPCRRRKPHRVVEQRLGRTNLDQHGGQTSEVGKERRKPGILPVHASGHIGLGEFGEVASVDERIDPIVRDKRRTRQRQIGPGGDQPGAAGESFARIAQRLQQRECQAGRPRCRRNAIGGGASPAEEALRC